MRIVEGRGKGRQVTELPGLAVRARDEKAHQTLIENLQERICPRDMAHISLGRKGVRVYR